MNCRWTKWCSAKILNSGVAEKSVFPWMESQSIELLLRNFKFEKFSMKGPFFRKKRKNLKGFFWREVTKVEVNADVCV